MEGHIVTRVGVELKPPLVKTVVVRDQLAAHAQIFDAETRHRRVRHAVIIAAHVGGEGGCETAECTRSQEALTSCARGCGGNNTAGRRNGEVRGPVRDVLITTATREYEWVMRQPRHSTSRLYRLTGSKPVKKGPYTRCMCYCESSI